MSMLQRFSLASIAQTIKNTTSQQHEYSKEEIENAISEIKMLGKRAVAEQERQGTNAMQPSVDVAQDIKTILKLMKKFDHNLYVQRVSCHALSNLAMQVVIARHIVTNNGFQHIKNALQRFQNDHKLCWLASSAIWNLARPPANREIIGKNGVSLMLKVLSNHYQTQEKVTNTAIGALSNLSLYEAVKPLICQKDNITLIIKVLSLYSSSENRSVSVMTSGAGLLANLAVSDEHAETLLQYDTLPVLLNLLQWSANKVAQEEKNNDAETEQEQEQEAVAEEQTPETTMHRNSCAALNNMVTAKQFINKVLQCNGIETIYSFLKTTKNSLFISLLENCLTTLECDIKNPVTTLHLCGLHNQKDLLQKMIQTASDIDNKMDLDESPQQDDASELSDELTPSIGSHIWGDKQADMFTVKQLLNQKDGNNMTTIQYAALGKHYQLIEFLVKCGADASMLSENIETSDDSDMQSHQSQMDKAISNGEITMKSIAEQHRQAICDTLEDFPTDLCNLISSFENEIDMLQVANQFE